MTSPFFITGLPRSRSAWLSAFFSDSVTVCYHDLLGKVGSLEEMRELLPDGNYGDSDSGLLLDPKRIESMWPQSRWGVIGRAWDEVLTSIDSFMDKGPWKDQPRMLPEAKAFLAQKCSDAFKYLAAKQNVIFIDYNDLDSLDTIKELWAFLRPGKPFSEERWRVMNSLNIQVDQRKVAYMPKNPKIICQ